MGGKHKALNLNIPENIILLFQPAYSPQVNPIERLWEYLKEDFKWINFETVEELQDAITKNLNKLTDQAYCLQQRLRSRQNYWVEIYY